MEPDVWKVEHLVFRLVYNTCNTREIYQLRYPMFDHRFAKLSSWTPFGNDTKRLQSWLPEVERVIEMEPRNKQALIWIIAFFLILNVGLGLFALMAA